MGAVLPVIQDAIAIRGPNSFSKVAVWTLTDVINANTYVATGVDALLVEQGNIADVAGALTAGGVEFSSADQAF